MPPRTGNLRVEMHAFLYPHKIDDPEAYGAPLRNGRDGMRSIDFLKKESSRSELAFLCFGCDLWRRIL